MLYLEWELQEDLDERMQKDIEQAMEAVLALEGISRTVCAYLRVLSDEEEMRRINRTRRGVDASTDVLSFPTLRLKGALAKNHPKAMAREYDPELGGVFVGDILLCAPIARKQAMEYGHTIAREMAYLCAHALLHLLGYDHLIEEEKTIMRAREEAAMKQAGLER